MEIRSDRFIGLEFHIILDSRWRTLDDELWKTWKNDFLRIFGDPSEVRADAGQHDDDEVKVNNL